MVEVIGDVVMPSEFVLAQLTTTKINTISGAGCMSGTMFYNTTLDKVEFHNGSQIETITSTAR